MKMKIFISQKMRDKTHEEIVYERDVIFSKWAEFRVAIYDQKINSYLSEFKLKDPIKCLANSLSLMADADIVLVPKSVISNFFHSHGLDIELWQSMRVPVHKFYAEHIKNLKGCEFEFLIALSYGKKVYYYDDNYKFTEVK